MSKLYFNNLLFLFVKKKFGWRKKSLGEIIVGQNKIWFEILLGKNKNKVLNVGWGKKIVIDYTIFG